MVRRSRGRVALGIAWLALAVSAAACGGGSAPDLSGTRAVSFDSADGVRLEGRLFGEGSRAVILSHMRASDQRAWYPFAERLADQGYLVLTFDFRGTCPGGDGGCSAGELTIGDLWQDVAAAVSFVRSEGAGPVSLVGASMGGTASLVAAASGIDVRAVVAISAPTSIEGLAVDGPTLSNVTVPKLFVAGVGDASAAADAQTLYRIAPPPKRVEIVPADDHGTDLLSGARAEEVRRLIETFLASAAG